MHFLKQFVLVGIFCYFVDAAPATEWVDNPEVALRKFCEFFEKVKNW